MRKKIIPQKGRRNWKMCVLCGVLAVFTMAGVFFVFRSLFHYSSIDYPSTLEIHLGDWDGGYSSDTPTNEELKYAFQVRKYAIEQFDEHMEAFNPKQFHYYNVYYDQAHEVWMVQADVSRSKHVMGGVYWLACTKDGRIIKMWGER